MPTHPELRAVTFVLVAAVAALGCLAAGETQDPSAVAERLGMDPAGVVIVGSTGVVSAVDTDGRVTVLAIEPRDGAWAVSPITSSPGRVGTDSVHLLTYGGATGEPWNTFVYGTASPGTVRVELQGRPNQRGGIVTGGAWIIALPDKDLGPGDLDWRFVGSDGTSRRGTGIFPPDA